MTQPSDDSAPRHDGSGANDGYTSEVIPAENFGTDDTASDRLSDQDSLSTQDTYRGDFSGDYDTSDSDDSGKGGAAKEQAGAMKDSAKQSGQKVAGTAKDQASQVKAEAGKEAKGMVKSGLSEASSQLGTQQKRLAGGLQSVADEFGSMADNSEKSGPVTDLARQAADKGGQLAQRLEHSEPSELLEDVKNFARRRPVAFLGIAAVTGVVVGRLTRGIAADSKSSDSGSNGQSFSDSDSGSRFRGDSQGDTYRDNDTYQDQSGTGGAL